MLAKPTSASPSGVADVVSPNRNQIEKSNKALTRKAMLNKDPL